MILFQHPSVHRQLLQNFSILLAVRPAKDRGTSTRRSSTSVTIYLGYRLSLLSVAAVSCSDCERLLRRCLSRDPSLSSLSSQARAPCQDRCAWVCLCFHGCPSPQTLAAFLKLGRSETNFRNFYHDQILTTVLSLDEQQASETMLCR